MTTRIGTWRRRAGGQGVWAAVILVLVLGLAAPGVTAAEAGANLVPNPGFEEVDAAGLAVGWSMPPPVYSLDSAVFRSGARSLRYVNADPQRYQLASFAIPFAAGQRFEFEVWVRTENVQGDDSGATLCMEWYDANQTYLGGSYPSGAKGTSAGWRRVHGVSGKAPERAARGTVTCYVRRGMTGTAWFDDVAVRRYYPPLITGMTADRHRATYAGEAAEIVVGLESEAANGPGTDLALEAVLLADTDAPVAPVALRRPQPDLAVVRVDTAPLAPRTYRVRVTATAAGGARRAEAELRLIRVAEPVPRRVTIDEFGRTLIEGEPFFPLGTYWSGISAEHLTRYAASPFNCLMPYGAPNQEQMDLIQRHGLKVIYSIKDLYAGTTWCPKTITREADERPAVEAVVRQYRQHPALLAWYLNDELPVDLIERLAAHQQWLEELDPDHPTWVVLYQVDDVRRYLSSFDVIGTDPYPIPSRPASQALAWTRSTHEGALGRRAVWQVPQIFNWAAYKKGEERAKFRAPTELEMRSMAWQCIAGGANGLIFYSWFDLWKMNDTDPFEVRWQEVTRMAEEIRKLFPVLLSVESLPELRVSAPADVAWRAWRRGDDLYVLMVNSGTTTATATLTLPRPAIAVASELEGPRGTLRGPAVELTLDGLVPQVLRVRLAP